MLASSVLLALSLTSGCGPGAREARETIEAFLTAVQNDDRDRLYCLMAGASEAAELGATDEARRSGFGAWVDSQLAAYEQGRDVGEVPLDEQGIVAVKLFALGKGTFYDLGVAERTDPAVMRVPMNLRFGYAAVDLSGFSPGTTFYVCGVPLGRVHAIRKPVAGGEESAEVLDRLGLMWTLAYSDGGGACPAGWRVASVSPVEGTVTTKRVSWVF